MTIIVADGFLPDPARVRRDGVCGEFCVSGNYPGRRSTPYAGFDARDALARLTGPIAYWPGGPESYNGAFQLVLASDGDSWIHHDDTKWAAVLFLNPVWPSDHGTVFYRHRETGIEAHAPPLPDYNVVPHRPEDWTETVRVGGAWNRLVAYHGNRYHRSGDLGGETKPAAAASRSHGSGVEKMLDDVLVAVITHADCPRLIRTVDSVACCANVVVVVNTPDESYRDKVRAAPLPGHVEVVYEDRPGCPGGRNAVLDYFVGSTDFPYMSQIDGDDVCYPTYPVAVAEARRRAPGLDALCLVPVDVIHDGEQGEPLGDGLNAWVWGTSEVFPEGTVPGPSTDPTLHLELSTCPAMIRLVSRRLAARHRYDEGILNGEDHLMLLTYLKDHQDGVAQVWVSMSSDWMLVDRTTPTSSQKIHPQAESMGPLRAGVERLGIGWRTGIGELPWMYPPMLMRYDDKIEFARRATRLPGCP